MKKFMILLTAALVIGFVAPAQAKSRHYGSCDGIHRCRCGHVQASHFGLPRNFNGHNLWRAVEWVHAFPRTTIHVGAVGYVRHGGPSGHVFRIAAYSGGPTATVSDDAGTYERRITNAIFVDPSGNHVQYSAKSHRRQYASAEFVMSDRGKGAF